VKRNSPTVGGRKIWSRLKDFFEGKEPIHPILSGGRWAGAETERTSFPSPVQEEGAEEAKTSVIPTEGGYGKGKRGAYTSIGRFQQEGEKKKDSAGDEAGYPRGPSTAQEGLGSARGSTFEGGFTTLGCDKKKIGSQGG